MTREELKEHCEKQIENCEMWATWKEEEPSGKFYEEHKLILELLEQEPCDDCVSREDVKKFINNLTRWVVRKDSFVNEGLLYDDVMFGLDELPSAQPARIKAKWEKLEDDEECSICSNCHYDVVYESNYCPYCGADMRGAGICQN